MYEPTPYDDGDEPHAEHRMPRDRAEYTIDGVGQREAERVDGTPLLAVRERRECARDHCDAAGRVAHVFVLEDVPNDVVETVRYLLGEYGSDDEEVAAELADRATVRHDPDGVAVAFEVGTTQRGATYPRDSERGGFGGLCYGDEPNLVDETQYRERHH